jgi:lysine 2,3-aminomutase
MRLEDRIKPARRAPVWADVPDDKWNDWRWQLSHRLNSVDELNQVITLTESEKKALVTNGLFRVDITPYFASLMDPADLLDPIRLQVIPTDAELVPFTSMMEDSLAEDKHSPVPGLVHRYPDRVLMLVTTQCASYCRYCTRSRIVGDPSAQFSRSDYDAQIEYLERTPQVRDVLLSGGDPLVLAPKLLENLISRLRAIPHIEIIRIGSRVPVFMPQRVDQDLCDMLARYHPVWLNIHVNHPNEITQELAQACDRLTRAGVPLGNQAVLLAGVNDSVHIQRELLHQLVMLRVRPYYLYQCDLVEGAGHFRTTVNKGIEIMEGLRGHTSGYAVPTYVIDAPGGGGKIPVTPNYVVSAAPGKVVLRNFEGFLTTYSEPTDYDPEAIRHLDAQVSRRPEPGQSGVLGLLQGERMTIEPEGFGAIHTRGDGHQHRLNADGHKWQPLGIGDAMPGIGEAAPGTQAAPATDAEKPPPAANVIEGKVRS